MIRFGPAKKNTDLDLSLTYRSLAFVDKNWEDRAVRYDSFMYACFLKKKYRDKILIYTVCAYAAIVLSNKFENASTWYLLQCLSVRLKISEDKYVIRSLSLTLLASLFYYHFARV